MKKSLAILLCMVLAVNLCACAGDLSKVELPPLPEVTQEPSAAPQETEVTAQPEEVSEEVSEPESQSPEELSGQIIVNFKHSETEAFDPEEGTQRILTFAYDTPVIYVAGRDEAAAAINEFIARLDETYYTGNDYGEGYSTGYYGLLEQAEDNFTYVRSEGLDILPLEFASDRSVRVERADSTVLSLVFTEYVYLGGAHGSYVDRGYMFDTVTGERLELDDLSGDPEALRSLLTQKLLVIADSDEEIQLAMEGYTEDRDTALAALVREGSWYLGQDGLVIFSDIYEIAPYASGILHFVIPYEELQGYLDPKWIPAQRLGEGTFTVKPMSEVEEGSVEIVDRVAFADEGTELCLTAQGTVYDVRLQNVNFVEDIGFIDANVQWYCSYLQDSAVQIAVIVPEVIPNLRVSYQTADGAEHKLVLSQSGEDGSYLLLEEDALSPADSADNAG